ncbi:hypothetical protein QS10_16335, partial [Salmonella enterica subsp. enterica serovar Agona]
MWRVFCLELRVAVPPGAGIAGPRWFFLWGSPPFPFCSCRRRALSAVEEAAATVGVDPPLKKKTKKENRDTDD